MKKVKQELTDELSSVLDVDVSVGDIEATEGEHGDFAYPMMKAANQVGEPPRELAEEASGNIELEFVEKVEVAGPGYLNFFLDREEYASNVLEELGRENMGVEQREGKMLVEFSSPNVAKPMHVGHFRNNALGDSLQRIMKFVGYDVTSENYLGDWGTQYGKLIYAFKEYGSEQEFEEAPMEHMFELYVKFHEEAENEDEMEDKGREWAAKVEEGDEEARKLWEKFREASIQYHKEDYRRMNIEFDRWTGESKVVEESREMVMNWLEESRLERDGDGSVFIEFDGQDLPGTVILKEDGSTLYLTRDLYNLKKRNQEGFGYNFYVVGSEQELHFQQVFAAAEELGLDSSGSEHISYGLLSLPEGSMSSRRGRIIRLEHALDEAVERAEEKASQKMEREVENAEAIGIGALKYANLAVSRKKNIEFDWDRALSFEGDSGPYLQYSNVRAKSILKKADAEGELLGGLEEQEYSLLKKLGEFPEKVDASVRDRDPAKIANYLSLLCEDFNSFYHDCPVIDADDETRERRLALVELFVEVTDKGLELLGIEPLEEM